MSYCIVSYYPEMSHPLYPYAAMLLDKAESLQNADTFEARKQDYALTSTHGLKRHDRLE